MEGGFRGLAGGAKRGGAVGRTLGKRRLGLGRDAFAAYGGCAFAAALARGRRFLCAYRALSERNTETGQERVYSFAELPDAIRRELPKLTYGGGSYSGDKASRLAFLNGQVFHEGDTIAPGLVLRQIKQKGVILAYKGYRFELGT